jgi:cytidine deaminase
MNYQDLNTHDYELIDRAKAKINYAFDEPYHKLVTAIQTEEGNTHYGINLQLHHIRRASVCSDAGAISNVMLAKEHPTSLVAVRKPLSSEENQEVEVVNPCGLCREMLTDYYPTLMVIVSTPDGLKKCSASAFLPLKYGV